MGDLLRVEDISPMPASERRFATYQEEQDISSLMSNLIDTAYGFRGIGVEEASNPGPLRTSARARKEEAQFSLASMILQTYWQEWVSAVQCGLSLVG